MNLKTILQAPYLLPAILDHLVEPTETTTELLTDFGITCGDLEELKTIETLLVYHLDVIQSNFKQSRYALLTDGLDDYNTLYNSNVFNSLRLINTNHTLYDIGCGSGYYCKRFIELNPGGLALGIDKRNNLKYCFDTRFNFKALDFESMDWISFVSDNNDRADIVLLSEVLHCKTYHTQRGLIHDAANLLHGNGMLIVIENDDAAMAYRISKLKGSPHEQIKAENMEILIGDMPFKPVTTIKSGLHRIFVYVKI